MNPETGKKIRENVARLAARPAADVAASILRGWQDSLSAPPCATTGIAPLDALMPGLLLPGRTIVIGARPAVGKTALALQIAEHVGVAHDSDVVIVSLEMTGEALGRRFVVARAISNGRPLRDPNLWRDEADAAEIFDGLSAWGQMPFCIIDEDRRRNAVHAAICAAVNASRERGRRVGLVVVDYLQQITDDNAATREREVGAASVMLAEAAKHLNVAMLVLAQLNRGPATSAADPRPPVVTDLRDSGQIEQDADAVLLLHRPQQAQQQPQPVAPREAQIIVGKSRHWPAEPGHVIKMEDHGLRWVPAAPSPQAARTNTKPRLGAGIPGYGLPQAIAAGWVVRDPKTGKIEIPGVEEENKNEKGN